MYHCSKSIIEYIDKNNDLDKDEKEEYIKLFKGQVTLYECFFILISGIKEDYEKLMESNKEREKCLQNSRDFENKINEINNENNNLTIFNKYEFFNKIKKSYDGYPVFENFYDDIE